MPFWERSCKRALGADAHPERLQDREGNGVLGLAKPTEGSVRGGGGSSGTAGLATAHTQDPSILRAIGSFMIKSNRILHCEAQEVLTITILGHCYLVFVGAVAKLWATKATANSHIGIKSLGRGSLPRSLVSISTEMPLDSHTFLGLQVVE